MLINESTDKDNTVSSSSLIYFLNGKKERQIQVKEATIPFLDLNMELKI